jgi:hypothetical protein
VSWVACAASPTKAHTTGSIALTVLASIHLAIYVLLFWILLANGIIATQVVE